jgi:hypothetical protein
MNQSGKGGTGARRLLAWAGVAVTIAHAAAAVDGPAEPASAPRAEPFESTVGVAVTPGKPSAATETVTATRRDGACSLRVERRSPTGELIDEETVTLPADEFAAVWRHVVDGRLRSFVPEEEADKVFDFGDRRLVVTTRATRDGSPETARATWRRPLRNGAAVAALMDALARLARDRARRVPLVYLTPPPG